MTFTTEYTDAKKLTTEAQALKVKKLIELENHDQATAIIAQNSDIINSGLLSVEAELKSNSQLTPNSKKDKKLLLDHIAFGYNMLHLINDGKYDQAGSMLKMFPYLADFKDRQGNTPLHLAILKEAPKEFINSLATDKQRFKVANNAGLTPEDTEEGIKLMAVVKELEKNTNPTHSYIKLQLAGINNPKLLNFQDAKGNTPLHKIMHLCEGNTENIMVKNLLTDKNRKDLKNKEGFSTQDIIQGYQLFRAIAKAKATAQEINQILEQNPKLVNFKDFEESTPLHQAAYSLNEGIAELLIAKGANINAQNIYGDTAVHNSAIASISDFKETRVIALDMIEFLSNKGADLKLANKDDKTALNIVVESRLEEADKQENTASTYSTKTPTKAPKNIFKKIIKFIKEITLKISIFKKQEESAKGPNTTEVKTHRALSPDHTPPSTTQHKPARSKNL